MIKFSPRRKLSDKLLLISSFVIVIALLSIALVFTVYTEHEARNNLQQDLKVLARVVGGRSAAALVFNDEKGALGNLRSTALNESVVKACLYDAQAALFASHAEESGAPGCALDLDDAQEGVTEQNGLLVVTHRIEDAGDTIGYMTIYAGTERLTQILNNALAVSLLTLLGLLPFAVLVLKRLIKRVLEPLTMLHHTAQKVAENPFSSVRAARQQDDEVGQLVAVFNAMLDKLGEENNALYASENRFRLLAENSPVGIYQMDEDGNIVYANDRWRALTGLSASASRAELRNAIQGDDQERYEALLHKMRAQHRPQVLEYSYRAEHGEEESMFMEHLAPLLEQRDGKTVFRGSIGSLMDISELKTAQLELENLAFYDPLTSLPNRRFFRDHLRQLMSQNEQGEQRIAMLMIDLDDFKKVNDTLGHDTGDQLLVILAERLRSQVAKRDVVSRMGGDEFMILLRDADIRTTVERVAERILRSVEQPILVNNHELEVSASIGVAIYPDDAESVETLIRNADLALYLAKESGRNRLSFFSRKLETELNEKVRLERKIRDALRSDAFSFHVQPQWYLHNAAVHACEVLIRWNDKEEGMISPAAFIPVAEQSGLIVGIGEWLIDKVIQTIAEHRDDIERLGVRTFAINLSAKQLFSSSLVATVERLLDKYAVDATMLEFELTESAVMDDALLAIEVMQKLKTLGCRISIDDFGTGYSSLAYLKKFPIDAVKIDQSFVSDIPSDQNDMEISAAIIAMGHNLGLKVVAEGVETQAQLDFLLEQGCDIAQGYFIAKPMPFDTFLATAPTLHCAHSDGVRRYAGKQD